MLRKTICWQPYSLVCRKWQNRLPGVAENSRFAALNAAAQSCLDSARELEYGEDGAQQWTAVVMERLHDEMKRSQANAPSAGCGTLARPNVTAPAINSGKTIQVVASCLFPSTGLKHKPA